MFRIRRSKRVGEWHHGSGPVFPFRYRRTVFETGLVRLSRYFNPLQNHKRKSGSGKKRKGRHDVLLIYYERDQPFQLLAVLAQSICRILWLNNESFFEVLSNLPHARNFNPRHIESFPMLRTSTRRLNKRTSKYLTETKCRDLILRSRESSGWPRAGEGASNGSRKTEREFYWEGTRHVEASRRRIR